MLLYTYSNKKDKEMTAIIILIAMPMMPFVIGYSYAIARSAHYDPTWENAGL